MAADGLRRIPCMKPPSTYTITVGPGALERAALDLAPGGPLRCTPATSLVILSDTNVWRHHGPRLLAALAAARLPPPLLKLLPPGEAAKSRAVKEGVEDWMLAQRCLRDTAILAFGGGVVGDLAGFVAATYMRGVAVVQLPTTLLAMVDSAVGGKTGLDVPAGKNLVGAFHQPRGVYADPSLLATLPVREVSNGMAEIIKCGAIASAALFDLCEARAEDALRGDAALLSELIAEAAGIKARVCTEDEKEGGLRSILNWGHTVGHGIEAEMQPELLHGECVAIGMVKEAEAARALGHCDSALVNRVKRVCRALQLPVAVPPRLAGGEGLRAVLRRMGVDKKNTGGGSSGESPAIKCVLLRAIGEVACPPYAHSVPQRLLARLLGAEVELSPAPAQQLVTPQSGPTRVRVPGSKSVSNRALLLAGLSSGTTQISGLLASDDTQVMLACLRDMGAEAKHGADGEGRPVLLLRGTGGAFSLPPQKQEGGGRKALYVQNAGTASRFLASVAALLPFECGGGGAGSESVVLEGNARMAVRPIGPLVDALRDQGVRVAYTGGEGCLPLAFSGGLCAGRDSKGEAPAGTVPRRRVVRLKAKLSSQYVSSILMAAPFFPPVLTTAACAAEARAASEASGDDPTHGDPSYTELALEEEAPTSLPYILMTLATMAEFGVTVVRLGPNRFLVPRGCYTSPGAYSVEADASSASYPAAFGAVARAGAPPILLEGVGSGSSQGDAGFPALLGRMGAVVAVGRDWTTVAPPPQGEGLRGIDVNMAEQTDCFMTLAVVAALASGTTRITGIANQRVKECNRIAAMVAEFSKVGVVARELPDGLEVEGSGLLGVEGLGTEGQALLRTPSSAPRAARLHCHDDHRIAMAFSILATAVPGIVLDDAACVEKTFPEYWDTAEAVLGLRVEAAGLMGGGGDAAAANAPPSTVLIGMRGSGKSSLAVAGSAALGWIAVDLDRVLEQREGVPLADLIARVGWEAFREKEAALLEEALAVPSGWAVRGAVVACGGGVVESARARAFLTQWPSQSGGGRVVEVTRDVADICEDLGVPFEGGAVAAGAAAGTPTPSDAGRPPYAGGASLPETYARRRAWYAQCSTHAFFVPSGDRAWGATRSRFCALLKQLLRGSEAAPLLAAASMAGSPTGVPIAVWPTTQGGADGSGETEVEHGGVCGWPPPLTAPPPPRPDAPWPAPNCGAPCSEGSTFVCLALPTLQALLPPLPQEGATAPDPAVLADRLYEVALGADAVELRVDLLQPPTGEHAAAALASLRALLQLGTLRALARGEPSRAPPSNGRVAPEVQPHPIIFTVRSSTEGGAFNGTEAEYLALLRVGVRCGAEWVDVEAGRCSGALLAGRTAFAQEARGSGARVIGSAHWPAATPQPSRGALCAAALSAHSGGTLGDAVKLVVAVDAPWRAAAYLEDAAEARKCVAGAASSCGVSLPPFIALAMGSAGRLTRALNTFFTPVTHALLPAAAAPGQVTGAALRTLRAALGLGGASSPRAFYLFGRPVAQSLSPALHNAAFRALGLPHGYGLVDTVDAAEVARLVGGGGGGVGGVVAPRSGAFEGGALPSAIGGANITMPLKQEIIPFCAAISPEAAAIGAVNVLVALPGGLYGANTDWLGVYWPLAQRLQQQQQGSGSGGIALIVGAGGTARAACYAASRLGLRVRVHNPRTPGKAGALAAAFGGEEVASLDAPCPRLLPAQPRVLITTLPPSAGWVAPQWLLRGGGPVVFDVAYRPRVTPLLAQAAAEGCDTVEGVEMLVCQGLGALALWLGKGGRGGLCGAGVPAAEATRAVYEALEADGSA